MLVVARSQQGYSGRCPATNERLQIDEWRETAVLLAQARSQPRVFSVCAARAWGRVAAVERHPNNVRRLRVRAKKAQNPPRLLRLLRQRGLFAGQTHHLSVHYEPRVVIWQHLQRWNSRAARNRRLGASWSSPKPLGFWSSCLTPSAISLNEASGGGRHRCCARGSTLEKAAAWLPRGSPGPAAADSCRAAKAPSGETEPSDAAIAPQNA